MTRPARRGAHGYPEFIQTRDTVVTDRTTS